MCSSRKTSRIRSCAGSTHVRGADVVPACAAVRTAVSALKGEPGGRHAILSPSLTQLRHSPECWLLASALQLGATWAGEKRVRHCCLHVAVGRG
jgi:hypothetical protein